MPISIHELRQEINRLGFQSMGVAKAQRLTKEAQQLEDWLNKGYHGEMSYMERYFDLRIDPEKLMPGTKSILVLGMNYYQSSKNNEQVKIARYAYGDDYHKVLRKKSKELNQWMKSKYGDIQFRAFVDSAPVMERVWAEKSGLAWSGKNTLSISPGIGSYYFLMCVFTDVEFEMTDPIKDYCGTCRRCIEACPTEAISSSGYLLDASKCISYLTIELKNQIPESFKDQMEGWAFGCDICQEVCPWNRFSQDTEIQEFKYRENLLNLNIDDWINLLPKQWEEITKKSAIRRTGLEGMKRNARFLKKS